MEAFDLHVHIPKSLSSKELPRISNLAKELGFTGIAVEGGIPPLKSANDEAALLVLSRRTLSLRSAARIRFKAEKQRAQVDLLVIHGTTKPIMLAASRVAAVDLVMLREPKDFSAVDSQVVRSLAKANLGVEVCLSGLLQLIGPPRSRLIRSMTTAMKYFQRASSSLVLTSGASSFYGLRAPRDLAALAYLVNIPEDVAKQGVFDVPAALVAQLGYNETESKRFAKLDSEGR